MRYRYTDSDRKTVKGFEIGKNDYWVPFQWNTTQLFKVTWKDTYDRVETISYLVNEPQPFHLIIKNPLLFLLETCLRPCYKLQAQIWLFSKDTQAQRFVEKECAKCIKLLNTSKNTLLGTSFWADIT